MTDATKALFASLRWKLSRRRKYVVAAEHPDGNVGESIHVKARDEAEALRHALYVMFKRNVSEWYSWKYEVRRG